MGRCLQNCRLWLAIQAEFEVICEDAQLWVKLITLDEICSEQGLSDTAPPRPVSLVRLRD